MKKMTVTELEALTGYVVESVLNAKRDAMKKSVSNISENELNELFEKAQKLCNAKAAARMAYDQAKDELMAFSRGLSGKNFEGRYVYVNEYSESATAKIGTMEDDRLFEKSELAPWKLKQDIKRKLILKNLGSEVDVEKFIEELVASY